MFVKKVVWIEATISNNDSRSWVRYRLTQPTKSFLELTAEGAEGAERRGRI
jgi:hypothetical protein